MLRVVLHVNRRRQWLCAAAGSTDAGKPWTSLGRAAHLRPALAVELVEFGILQCLRDFHHAVTAGGWQDRAQKQDQAAAAACAQGLGRAMRGTARVDSGRRSRAATGFVTSPPRKPARQLWLRHSLCRTHARKLKHTTASPSCTGPTTGGTGGSRSVQHWEGRANSTFAVMQSPATCKTSARAGVLPPLARPPGKLIR